VDALAVALGALVAEVVHPRGLLLRHRGLGDGLGIIYEALHGGRVLHGVLRVRVGVEVAGGLCGPRRGLRGRRDDL
jgi:hypothetical protein